MAQKDITQKLLEDYEDVFADIVNVLVFDGEEVVHPNALEASNLRSQYKAASDGMLHEQERDVVKYWKDGDLRIGLIGLENQIKVEREMVLRVLGYDIAGGIYRRSRIWGNDSVYFERRHYNVQSCRTVQK